MCQWPRKETKGVPEVKQSARIVVQTITFAKWKAGKHGSYLSKCPQQNRVLLHCIHKQQVQMVCIKKNCALLTTQCVTRAVELLSSCHIKHFAIDSHEDSGICHSVILLQVLQSEVSLLQSG